MTNGYMVYLLRILAAQGALASVYTDPDDPEGFSAGFVEAVDGQHVLMCDLSPWGQIDGWRVRRNRTSFRCSRGRNMNSGWRCCSLITSSIIAAFLRKRLRRIPICF